MLSSAKICFQEFTKAQIFNNHKVCHSLPKTGKISKVLGFRYLPASYLAVSNWDYNQVAGFFQILNFAEREVKL